MDRRSFVTNFLGCNYKYNHNKKERILAVYGWDEEKSRAILEKHALILEDTETVFY